MSNYKMLDEFIDNESMYRYNITNEHKSKIKQSIQNNVFRCTSGIRNLSSTSKAT